MAVPLPNSDLAYDGAFDPSSYLSQSCKAASLYSPSAFEVPYGFSLPYVKAGQAHRRSSMPRLIPMPKPCNRRILRDIESTVNPHYLAKNDTLELNADYNVTPALTFTSQTGFNHDFLWSTEDYNRFNTAPGIFVPANFVQNAGQHPGEYSPYTDCGVGPGPHVSDGNGYFDDPQVGCADRLVAIDLSDEHAWQLSQEFRLASNFSGPLNFSVGGNFLHYETEENYYVFINALTLYALGSFGGGVGDVPWVPGVSDNHQCLQGVLAYQYGYQYLSIQQEADSGPSQDQCNYIDPNPITSLNNRGHNYFLSQNPYVLNSYAGFGEAYYQVLPDLKLIGGLRWTDDQKHFTDIPSELADQWLGLCQLRRREPAMERMDGPLHRQLDAEARFHRSDAGLWFLCARLQGGRCQSARARSLFGNAAGNIGLPDPSADVQAGIHRCL